MNITKFFATIALTACLATPAHALTPDEQRLYKEMPDNFAMCSAYSFISSACLEKEGKSELARQYAAWSENQKEIAISLGGERFALERILQYTLTIQGKINFDCEKAKVEFEKPLAACRGVHEESKRILRKYQEEIRQPKK